MRLVDFHAHVLPGIDDGAKDIEEARKLLVSQKKQGIHTVVATPHYLKNTLITDFVKKRDEALEQVKREINEDIPEIIPAAEVELYYGFTQEENLERLCIQGTNYILIELPFEYWNEWIYEELYQLSAKHNLRPIIVHLDRYITTPRNLKYVDKIMRSEVLIQLNADALLKMSSRSIVKSFLKRDAFTVLGSDCHNSKKRRCLYSKACKVIKRKYGENVLHAIMQNGENILNNMPVYRALSE